MTGKPKRIIWGEESIRVEGKSPSLAQEEENQKVLTACHAEANSVRFRVMIGAYGPGTVTKPTPRYWWLLGESVTIECRDVEIANWFRSHLASFLKSLDKVVLEKVEE